MGDKNTGLWNTSVETGKVIPNKPELRAIMRVVLIYCGVFALACWLAGNPFSFTQRLDSGFVVRTGLSGTDSWNIFWWVTLLTVIFEFLDASAGMGYGTAMTPMLLLLGFSPQQIIPVILIQQALAGLTGAFLHNEFGNVEWKFHPMSESVRLSLIIAGAGCIAVVFSTSAVYGIFKLAEKWIKLYVAVLLAVMGLVSLFNRSKERQYKPKKMIFFGALAGFNKGIGGGGYGPVITIGGLLSGVPIKSMMAVTALSEGLVCTVSILTWIVMFLTGVSVDFILLPSMLLGSIFSSIMAPYTVKIVPAKFWKWFVPSYSCMLAAYALWKVAVKYIN